MSCSRAATTRVSAAPSARGQGSGLEGVIDLGDVLVVVGAAPLVEQTQHALDQRLDGLEALVGQPVHRKRIARGGPDRPRTIGHSRFRPSSAATLYASASVG